MTSVYLALIALVALATVCQTLVDIAKIITRHRQYIQKDRNHIDLN